MMSATYSIDCHAKPDLALSSGASAVQDFPLLDASVRWHDTWIMLASLIAVLVAAPAFAGVEITPSQVRTGYFLAPDCTPSADPSLYNECVCEASISKAQVSGVAPDAASAINASLAQLPEKLAEESCEGSPTAIPRDGLKVNTTSADYEVAYQNATTLTILITYSTYGAGAEHPLDGTEGFTFDLASGKVVDPILYLKPEQLSKADSFIKQELARKYPLALYEEAKTRADPYLSENGCDSCTLYYGKGGWMVRFQITSIAPYMTGEPEVAIPADIIPPPEKLIVKS